MRQQKTLLDRISLAADLPSETMPGLPLVELAGYTRVLVENHRGVTQYGNDKICIRVSYGQVCICGSGLELNVMTKEHLVICGKISTVILESGGCKR